MVRSNCGRKARKSCVLLPVYIRHVVLQRMRTGTHTQKQGYVTHMAGTTTGMIACIVTAGALKGVSEPCVPVGRDFVPVYCTGRSGPVGVGREHPCRFACLPLV